MNRKIIVKIYSICISLPFLFGCSKLIEVSLPKNQLPTDQVFADSLSAMSALSNLYFTLTNGINNNYSRHISLYTDDYVYTQQNNEFYSGNVSADNGTNNNLWGQFYEIIYSCNDILERVKDTNVLSETTKVMLINEAKFFRALSYYHLYVLYENVPLILHTNLDENRLAVQADSVTIFNQVISDLRDAKDGLSTDYPSANRARANKWSASALLAQVYLYQNQWQSALDEANAVLNSGMYPLSSDLSEVFLANSSETILQLWRVDGFVSDATIVIPSSRTIVPQFIVTDQLYSAFKNSDLRRKNWLGENIVSTDTTTTSYWFPYKYKNRSASNSAPEYLVLLRSSEQYLIRAESKARLGDVEGAINDLNVTRTRAGLVPITKKMDKESCLDAILKERRLEFFGEWAKRFIDLKRADKLNTVMGEYKDTWVINQSERLPIPVSEMIYNTNLIQNDGY